MMLTDIGPILSTLRRHRITAVLVVLEIALTCAIVSNAVFLFRDRLDWIATSSGIDEDRIIRIITSEVRGGVDDHSRTEGDLAALRAIPGVEAATVSNSLPFGGQSWNSGVKLQADQTSDTTQMANYYGERVGETLGTELVAGRYFEPGEYVWLDDVVAKKAKETGVVIITQTLANRLFPGKSALGQKLWVGDTPDTVIGVVRGLANAGGSAHDLTENTALWPWRETPQAGGTFVIRAAAGRTDDVLKVAVAALKSRDPRRVIVEKERYTDIRGDFFSGDRALAGLMVGICIALLVVTALGIVGLASFWVAQRHRQIGVRRALGARRIDVLRYFQTENFLLTTMGIVLGSVLAYGLNLFLMTHYELPRLPVVYLPIGAVAVWLLGQAAVLAPALRAAAVPPVVATRG